MFVCDSSWGGGGGRGVVLTLGNVGECAILFFIFLYISNFCPFNIDYSSTVSGSVPKSCCVCSVYAMTINKSLSLSLHENGVRWGSAS